MVACSIRIELPYSMTGFADESRDGSPGITCPPDVGIILFGSYPCDWNGGRVYANSDGLHLRSRGNESQVNSRKGAQELVKRAVSRVISSGFPFYATMTNTLPRPSDDERDAFDFLDGLADGGFGNATSAGSGGPKNGAIVADPGTGKKIRGRYGKSLLLVSSVIMRYEHPGLSYEECFGEYDMVVLRPEDVLTPDRGLNFGFLDSLDRDSRERAIILANSDCIRDCPYTGAHFRNISRHEKRRPLRKEEYLICRGGRGGVLHIRQEQIPELGEMGYHTLKFVRGSGTPEKVRQMFPEIELVPAVAAA